MALTQKEKTKTMPTSNPFLTVVNSNPFLKCIVYMEGIFSPRKIEQASVPLESAVDVKAVTTLL